MEQWLKVKKVVKSFNCKAINGKLLLYIGKIVLGIFVVWSDKTLLVSLRLKELFVKNWLKFTVHNKFTTSCLTTSCLTIWVLFIWFNYPHQFRCLISNWLHQISYQYQTINVCFSRACLSRLATSVFQWRFSILLFDIDRIVFLLFLSWLRLIK